MARHATSAEALETKCSNKSPSRKSEVAEPTNHSPTAHPGAKRRCAERGNERPAVAQAAVGAPPKRCPRAARAGFTRCPGTVNAASRAWYANQITQSKPCDVHGPWRPKGPHQLGTEVPSCPASSSSLGNLCRNCAPTEAEASPHRRAGPATQCRRGAIGQLPSSGCPLFKPGKPGNRGRQTWVELWAAAEAAFRGVSASGTTQLGCVGKIYRQVEARCHRCRRHCASYLPWAYIPHHHGVPSATLCFLRKRRSLNISTQRTDYSVQQAMEPHPSCDSHSKLRAPRRAEKGTPRAGRTPARSSRRSNSLRPVRGR